MNTHASSVRSRHAGRAPRTESSRENAIRMLLALLLLAALTASSAVMFGHFGGHAPHKLIGSGAIVNTPWMY